VRILFRKLSDTRHMLELIREDGRREEADCETRSYLRHDLIHYAAESQAGLEAGLWGNLAKGKTLEQLNHRAGRAMDETPELMVIEQIVGVLSGVVKGRSAAEIVAGVQSYAEELGWTVPAWFAVDFVKAVEERMRGLLGHWKATPHGGAMELVWPAAK
jgi:hypothetical protein